MSKVIFVVGGGIGNIVQATPAIQASAAEGHLVDLQLHCNSSNDVREIFSIPSVRKIFLLKEGVDGPYDHQLNGPFTPGERLPAKDHYRTKIHYAQHIPETEIYYDLAKHIGVKTPMPDITINIGQTGVAPEHKDTVAIYPGSKPNWSMKRWDKYDFLANKFKHVTIVGKQEDFISHGNPAWIKRKWTWSKHVAFYSGSLQAVAYYISKCKMFIGNDGGLAHVAAATKIPTFVLFGPTSTVKNKPFAKNAHVVAIDLPCRPCQYKKGKQIFNANKFDCPYHMKCMVDMSVDFVLNKIKEFS